MSIHRHITRSGYIMMVSMTMLTIVAGSSSEEVFSQIARFTARDPGVRTGVNGAGGFLSGLSTPDQQVFAAARAIFQEVASVQGSFPGTEVGLGPRFNLDSCAGCHANPDVGGTSPAINPQVEMAKKEGANNDVPVVY